MAHVRKTIRDALTSTLTGLATTGSNVYQTRVYPLAESRLPGLAIYTKNEETTYETINKPRTLGRDLTLVVEAYVKGTSGYDNTLDDIAKEIEVAVYNDVTLNGICKDVMITSFDADFSGEGDQPVAFATIEIVANYVTTEGSPEVAQ